MNIYLNQYIYDFTVEFFLQSYPLHLRIATDGLAVKKWKRTEFCNKACLIPGISVY